MNERDGKMSFSSDLADKLIVLEYISDGLAYDADTKVPKLAEEAIYKYIAYAILSSRTSTPEYVVARFKKESSAARRNAKLRLSNIKLDELLLQQLSQLLGNDSLHPLKYTDKVWIGENIFTGTQNIQRPHQNNGHPLLQNGYMNNKLYFSGTELGSSTQ